MHPFETAFFRNLFGLAFMLPWLVRAGLGTLRTRRLALYAWRSALGLASMLCWFAALALIPFAEAVALSFTTPLFATIGAALILGERVRARRWTATLVGFAGVLVILRPGSVALDWGAALAIASMALSAAIALIVKNLTRTEHPDAIATYMVLMMTPMSLVPALFVWSWPDPAIWPWLVAMGAMGSFGHMCFLRSFALAEASAVMPYDYTRMIFASVIGYIAFAEAPDEWTWAGAAIIAGAAIYIARREALLRQTAATVAAASAGDAPPPDQVSKRR
jgi:drug/metabolite transporter (DMT)-like permease